MNETAPLDSAMATTTSALGAFQNFVANSQTNVLYKAFTLVGILIVFSLWQPTQKFAVWAAWIILALLLIQQH